MGKINFKSLKNAPVFRKIAFGTWQTVGDPSVYGNIEIDVSETLIWLNQKNQHHSVKISLTHLVGKAAAMVLESRPEINGMIRLGKIYQREQIDVFFQVNVPGKESQSTDKIKSANLAGAVVHQANKLNATQIAETLHLKAKKLREHKDQEYNDAVGMFKFIPWWMSRWLLNLSSFLTYDLNLNLSSIGIPKDPFGSIMITNVGSMGIEQAWAPLVPYSRVPILLTLGAVRDRAWVVNGEIMIRPILNVGVTFDHRFMDGVHAAAMAKHFKECFNHPETYF